MERKKFESNTIASIDLRDCPEGKIFQPLEPLDDIYKKYFNGWQAPLAPWGGFRLDSGMEIAKDDEESVISFGKSDRMIIYDSLDFRDISISARARFIDTDAKPNEDRSDYHEAIAGIVFRLQTSRSYYQFGIEGRRRAVIYRRIDDEWLLMAEKAVDIDDSYVTLEVALDGDGIRCCCEELDVRFFCTDTTMKFGKAGYRSIGRSNLMSLEIKQTDSQSSRDKLRRNHRENKEQKLGESIPNAVLIKTIDLKSLGGHPIFSDFKEPGKYDMLVSSSESLKGMTIDGHTLWETAIQVSGIEFSKPHKNGRMIYGFTGSRGIKSQVDIQGRKSDTIISDEMIIVNGDDGSIIAREKMPEFNKTIRMPDYCQGSGNLTDTGGFDIVLREWRDDLGGGGVKLWAYDKSLKFLWHRELKGAWYGHHYAVQFFDVDGDGRDELLAGGTLFDSEGNILWTHDADQEVLRIAGAQHYDAVALGNFADDESVDPVAFLLGGSSGVYVVDGLTGKTRSFHRVGHAQGRMIGKVRDDIPGEQILVATRWGNMGILTLFSGNGDRLWTIQPDYIGQGARPVRWGDKSFIWTNTTGPVQSLYDGYGRRVKELTELRHLWGDRMRTLVSANAIKMGNDPSDYLCLSLEGKMYIFGPEN